jgi:N-acetylglucosamine kinase-like BadF-type ATPase
VALISGTGSAAYARNADGQASLCGGWGFLLGDEGSGYTIGRAAIRCAMEDRDMKGELRPLTCAVLRFLGVRSADELTKTIYRSDDPRATVAAVAPLVIQSAEESDTIAAAILDSAAHDLALLVARAARVVELDNDSFALATAGGVLVSSKQLQQQLQRELHGLALECQMSVVDEPLEGCLRLADPQFGGIGVDWQ